MAVSQGAGKERKAGRFWKAAAGLERQRWPRQTNDLIWRTVPHILTPKDVWITRFWRWGLGTFTVSPNCLACVFLCGFAFLEASSPTMTRINAGKHRPLPLGPEHLSATSY